MWDWGFGISRQTIALPLQVSLGVKDFGRRWGIGVRVLVFEFWAHRDYECYVLER